MLLTTIFLTSFKPNKLLQFSKIIKVIGVKYAVIFALEVLSKIIPKWSRLFCDSF